jgi:molecular chaperone GrpE
MTDQQNRIEPTLDAPGGAAEDNGALAIRVAELEQQLAAAKDQALRAMAELDNVRKRAEREIDSNRKYGAERLLGDLLAVCDSMDLGLKAAAAPEATVKSIADGVELTARQLTAFLEKHGVKLVDPQGQPFNPEWHEAVAMVPSAEVPANHVLSVMQKGYRLHERLLRPAMVVVASAPAGAATTS